MTKAGVLIHQWRRGQDIEPLLHRLADHYSMRPFLNTLDREWAKEGDRCYRRWR